MKTRLLVLTIIGYFLVTMIFFKSDFLFIISSIFGGTGAAGFPVLLQNFRQSDNNHIRDSQIGSLSIMPYFRLSDPGHSSDIDSNDFITKTKSALTYYIRQEFSSLLQDQLTLERLVVFLLILIL